MSINVKVLFCFHYPQEISFVLLPTCSDTTQSLDVSESCRSFSPRNRLLNNSMSPQNVVFYKFKENKD